MILLTLALVAISTLGMVAGDSHGNGWTKATNYDTVPIDFDKSRIEVYHTINPIDGYFSWGFDMKGDNDMLLGWEMQGNGKDTGKWRFSSCMTNSIKMNDEDFTGKRIWGFTKKNGLLSVMVDGKEVITGKAPGQADTQCDPAEKDWKSDWETKVTGLQFMVDLEYRIVPVDQKFNGGNNDSDRNNMSGSSKRCLSVAVLVSTLVAYLRF